MLDERGGERYNSGQRYVVRAILVAVIVLLLLLDVILR